MDAFIKSIAKLKHHLPSKSNKADMHAKICTVRLMPPSFAQLQSWTHPPTRSDQARCWRERLPFDRRRMFLIRPKSYRWLHDNPHASLMDSPWCLRVMSREHERSDIKRYPGTLPDHRAKYQPGFQERQDHTSASWRP